MRKMKKLLVLFVVMLLSAGLLTACGDKDNDTDSPSVTNVPKDDKKDNAENEQKNDAKEDGKGDAGKEAKLWDGRYSENSTGLISWVHFYEDGTYYAKYFDGGVLDAGTWELVDEVTTYQVSFESEETKDSAQTIIMTSYTSGTAVRVAYVEDELCDVSLGGMANHRSLVHDADYAYNPSVDEVAIQLYVFYANNDIGANFILNHDRTFEDVTGEFFASGKWEMTGVGVYQLTYDDGSTASLTVNASGKSGILTMADGMTVALTDDYRIGDDSNIQVLSLRFDGAEVGLPMSVNLRIDGYKDGSCKFIVEVAQVGAELLADEGTFEVSETMSPTFHFKLAGDLTGTPDYASASADGIMFSVNYVGDVEPEFNGALTPMTVNAELTGMYTPNASAGNTVPVIVTSMRCEDAQVGLPMGVALRLDCYDDGSAVLMVEIAQLGVELEADKGNYSISETMKYTFAFDTAGEVVGEPDYATATENGVDINVHYNGSVEVEFNGTLTPLNIDSVLVGTHSA